MSTTILLIRHGATATMDRLLAGRTPHIPLSEVGREQVSTLSKRIGTIHRLITSPIQRAMETSQIMTDHDHPLPESMVLFSEFDFGDWTGRSFEELTEDSRWLQFNEARDVARAPGGESMHDVQQRAVAGVRQLIREEQDRTVAIVTHADVIRAVVLHFTGTPIRNFWRFEIGCASISELRCGPEGDERLVRLNDTAHLQLA